MLILSRRQQESLFLGDQIKVTILGIHGQQVKVGIEAPKEISIQREEIYDCLQYKSHQEKQKK